MEFIFRRAKIEDIPFLVETIIEAEKSGTSILSYTTIFDLSEQEAIFYISKMLEEEVDGCELSISSFFLAEFENDIAGAVAVWLEGENGIPSTILKGNLLNYTLPKKNLEKAKGKGQIIKDLHIDYQHLALQIGLIYVSTNYRGQHLAGKMIDFVLSDFKKNCPELHEMQVQVFGNNIVAIKAYEKVGFIIVLTKESKNYEIKSLLPDSVKVLMTRKI